MDLRQLEALVGIADHGSFSAAAHALGTVQSNISGRIARLETELDTVLIDRATGLLTSDGALTVARSRRVLGELEALMEAPAFLRRPRPATPSHSWRTPSRTRSLWPRRWVGKVHATRSARESAIRRRCRRGHGH